MSDNEMAMAVGRAQSDAAHALIRAESAAKTAHVANGHSQAALLKIDSLREEVERHELRINDVEDTMTVEKESRLELARAVDRLARKLPEPKTPAEQLKDTWINAHARTKAKMVAALVALFSMPEVLKAFAQAIGRLLGRIPLG